MTNPYQPPAAYVVNAPRPAARSAFVLAAAAAFLASMYWAGLTLWLGLGAALGSGSVIQLILPLVFVVLYAMRGFQLLKGDVAAARRLIWLHVVGAAMAAIQLRAGAIVILLAIKIAINVFGAITAYRATRAHELAS